MSTELAIALISLVFSLTLGLVVIFLVFKYFELKQSLKDERALNIQRNKKNLIKHHALVLMYENDELDEDTAYEFAEMYLRGIESIAKNEMGMWTSTEKEPKE